MPPRLVSLSGYPDIPLDRVLLVVGRHPTCDVRVDSSRVSRRHCCLALGQEELLVRDLDSTNGTWINGGRVAEGVLRPGDELVVSHLRYRFEIEPASRRHIAHRVTCSEKRPSSERNEPGGTFECPEHFSAAPPQRN